MATEELTDWIEGYPLADRPGWYDLKYSQPLEIDQTSWRQWWSGNAWVSNGFDQRGDFSTWYHRGLKEPYYPPLSIDLPEHEKLDKPTHDLSAPAPHVMSIPDFLKTEPIIHPPGFIAWALGKLGL